MKLTVARIAQLVAIATATLAGNAVAQGAVDAKAAMHVGELYACLECHNPTTKVLGPSFKDIAAKYKNDKSAVDGLSAKVRQGSVGVWGQVPMPPSAIKEDELKLVLSWILTH